MEASGLLLIASLGAIAVLLMLYGYIFMYQRQHFLLLWFSGWSIIALNYFFDAFFPYFLRNNEQVFFLSLCSYFFANLLISWGTLLFLKIKVKTVQVFGIEIIWLTVFVVLAVQNLPPLYLIQFSTLPVLVIFSLVGIVMIRSAEQYGRLVVVLGLLDLAWVANNLAACYIFKIPHMAPYVISKIILLLNAIGLIQLYFKDQQGVICEGMDHIKYLTFHDALTGLYNKTYFDNKIQEMENNSAYLPISLIIGDMNGLKFVNDVFGHHEGDNKLKRIAHIIKEYCRPNDIVARWGGDEFAVILPNTDEETANSVMDKIRAACSRFQEMNLFSGLALGVATNTDGKTSLSTTLKEAEDLMYQNKLIEGRKVRGAIAETLVEVLQASNPEMKGHIERLQRYAKEFARVLGFSAENTNTLLRAAMLHDIGKIGISKDNMKKTPLNEAEWHVMRKHVEIGYRIAQASVEFAHLADIILCQQEWWNGQGYPHGLKEEEIPLMSRIISILDAFDVMTHQQHNIPAMTTEEALQELQRKAGSQFDPNLVQPFIQMMNENPTPDNA